MPQFYSLNGENVSKSEYEKARGINQEEIVKAKPLEVKEFKSKDLKKKIVKK